jgi:hypothetical protein
MLTGSVNARPHGDRELEGRDVFGRVPDIDTEQIVAGNDVLICPCDLDGQ